MSDRADAETSLDLHRAVMLRLYRGAVHSLNNAFTAALGEASFLADEYKHDSDVREACGHVIEQIERSADILRAVGKCENRNAAGPCDVGTLLRELGPLLESTSGSQHEYVIEIAESLPPAACSFADAQLALLATIHALLPPDAAGSRIRIDAHSRDESRSLTIAIEALPDRGVDARTRPQLGYARTFVEALGERLHEVADVHPLRVELELACDRSGD